MPEIFCYRTVTEELTDKETKKIIQIIKERGCLRLIVREIERERNCDLERLRVSEIKNENERDRN